MRDTKQTRRLFCEDVRTNVGQHRSKPLFWLAFQERGGEYSLVINNLPEERLRHLKDQIDALLAQTTDGTMKEQVNLCCCWNGTDERGLPTFTVSSTRPVKYDIGQGNVDGGLGSLRGLDERLLQQLHELTVQMICWIENAKVRKGVNAHE